MKQAYVKPSRLKTGLSIALPAFNEEGNIGAMVEQVIDVIQLRSDDFEVIVVDDGSRDNTSAAVEQLAKRYPRVRLVRHGTNQGYGSAVFDGLRNATKDLVFFTDSDRQFDLTEIDKLLDLIDSADIVVGYRAPRRDPFMRKLNGWGWNLLVALLFGPIIRDVDCAFKLMRRSVITHLRDKVHSRGATFSAEFIVKAKRSGFTIKEVAVHGHRPRLAGSPTGAKVSVILKAFKDLIKLRFNLSKSEGVDTASAPPTK